jgi:guanylate kinase
MTSQHRLGLLFVLIGPAGAGKNTLMNTVLRRINDLKQIATATTRRARPNELQGREHLFVDQEEFQRLRETNALIEAQEVNGEMYGMPRTIVEESIANQQDLIADIDIKGATYLRSVYPDNAVLIFIQQSSPDDLIANMQARGETAAEIDKRMHRVPMEMEYAPLCDYIITNEKGNIEQASETLYAIVLAERSHRSLLNLRVEKNLPRRIFTYVTSVIPICGSEILFRSVAPHYPTAQLTHGEFPHDAALRALQQDLGVVTSATNLYTDEYQKRGSESSFITPIALESHIEAHHEQINFCYLYHLDERINPPQGWNWITYQQTELPQAVSNAIRSLVGNIPASRPMESSNELA